MNRVWTIQCLKKKTEKASEKRAKWKKQNEKIISCT